MASPFAQAMNAARSQGEAPPLVVSKSQKRKRPLTKTTGRDARPGKRKRTTTSGGGGGKHKRPPCPTEQELIEKQQAIDANTRGKEMKAKIMSNYLIPLPLPADIDWETHKKAVTLYETDNFIKKKMRFGRPQQPKYRLFKETKEYLVFPTQYGLEQFGLPEPALDTRFKGKEIKVNYIGPPLYDVGEGNYDQVPMFDAIFNHVKRSGRGGIVVAATGSGKTPINWKLIAEMKVKTAIVLPNTPLYQQGPISMAKYLDIPPDRIGYIKAKKEVVKDKDVVFISLKTLAEHNYDPEFFSEFGLVIFDELHKVASDRLHRALLKVTRVPVIIGQTATYHRPNDGMEQLFPLFMGPIIYVGSPVTRGAQYVDVLEVKYMAGKQEIFTQYSAAMGQDTRNVFAMIDVLMYDEQRNKLILHTIARCMAAGRCIMIFTKLVEHGTLIYKECKKRFPDKVIVQATKDTKPAERDYIFKNRHDIVISTRGLFGYGTDMPYLDTVMEATPAKNEIEVDQSSGRLRPPKTITLPDGTKQVVLPNGVRQLYIYLSDCFGGFENWWPDVRKICENKGYVILPSEMILTNQFDNVDENHPSDVLPVVDMIE